MRTAAPGQSALLLLDVIDILNQRRIPYAILGAFAASFYGMVRASLDADAVISVHTSRSTLKLCSDLRAKKFDVAYRTGDQDDPIPAVINIRDRFQNRVDLLIGIRRMPAQAFRRVEVSSFMGAPINVLGREDFIASKIYAGGPQDIEDVIGVFKVSGQKLNLKLLKKITACYGSDCLQRLERLLKDTPLK